MLRINCLFLLYTYIFVIIIIITLITYEESNKINLTNKGLLLELNLLTYKND